MKIAILTLPLHTNYGGILQAYALQTVLERMGHEVEVETNAFKIGFKNIIYGLLSRYALRVLKVIRPNAKPMYIQYGKNKRIIRKNTDRFINDYIHSISDLKKNVSKYDVLIVGSDQVWRSRYNPDIAHFFLDFSKKLDIIRISYAASFGTDKWEFSNKLTSVCKELIKKFDGISVREEAGIVLCEKYLNVQAQMVLDPTLLLEKVDYLNLTKDRSYDFKGLIFSYFLDDSVEKMNILNSVSAMLKKDYFRVMPKSIYESIGPKYLDQCVFPEVEEWIESFNIAEFVVTDSFHGTVFSIIFNKPFIVIGNIERGTSRISSLLKKFNLSSRYIITDATCNIESILSEKIDWISVNRIIAKEKNKSMNFLNNALYK